MDMEKSQDLGRRKFPRLKDNIFILGALKANHADEFKTFTRDISGGGLMFETNRNIPTGSELEMEIYQPSNSDRKIISSVHAAAKVVWTKGIEKDSFEEGENRYQVGVEFSEIKEEGWRRIIQEKNFLDSIVDSVIALDKEGKIREVNQATLDLLGYKKKEDLVAFPFEKICKNFSLRGLQDKIPLAEQELMYLNRDGKEIPVSVNISDRVLYPDDTIFMARDISKIKELIAELTRSQEELKTSYTESKVSKDALVRSEKLAYTGRIAASIAHEIRNPLTNVSMSIQQLKKGNKIKQEGFKHVEIVERNIERINYLIKELLNCARPAKLNLQPYDIHKVIKDVLESNKTRISLQRIKVTKDFTSNPSTLRIDKEQIERTFLNLIVNAIESMPRGGNLTITTELNGNFFMAKIHDTGRGIHEKDIIKIFDPFFSTKSGGVGLGLTICYGIIVSHGGTIEVESKSRKGSTFIVSLPP